MKSPLILPTIAMLTFFLWLTHVNQVVADDVVKYDVEEALAVIRDCESENNPKAYNPADPITPSFGLYQFKTETFNHFGERYGLPHTDVWNPVEQHDIAKAMLLEGRSEHWKVCYQVYLDYLD